MEIDVFYHDRDELQFTNEYGEFKVEHILGINYEVRELRDNRFFRIGSIKLTRKQFKDPKIVFRAILLMEEEEVDNL